MIHQALLIAVALAYSAAMLAVGRRLSRPASIAAYRPSENEATTSGNVALPVHKTMASSTMITCPTVAKISVSQPV